MKRKIQLNLCPCSRGKYDNKFLLSLSKSLQSIFDKDPRSIFLLKQDNNNVTVKPVNRRFGDFDGHIRSAGYTQTIPGHINQDLMIKVFFCSDRKVQYQAFLISKCLFGDKQNETG